MGAAHQEDISFITVGVQCKHIVSLRQEWFNETRTLVVLLQCSGFIFL